MIGSLDEDIVCQTSLPPPLQSLAPHPLPMCTSLMTNYPEWLGTKHQDLYINTVNLLYFFFHKSFI